MPSKEPVQIIWYSGAFSQKYLSEVSAALQNCISSKIKSVFLGKITLPLKTPSSVIILLTSKSLDKTTKTTGVILCDQSKMLDMVYSFIET